MIKVGSLVRAKKKTTAYQLRQTNLQRDKVYKVERICRCRTRDELDCKHCPGGIYLEKHGPNDGCFTFSGHPILMEVRPPTKEKPKKRKEKHPVVNIHEVI